LNDIEGEKAVKIGNRVTVLIDFGDEQKLTLGTGGKLLAKKLY